MTQKIKQIIIVVVVIIIALVVFKKFFPSQSGDQALSVEQTSSENFIDGQIILSLLNQLERVTLDESIFSSSVFTSLVSVDRPLESQVLERKNPFLPIGVDSSSVYTPVSTSTAPAN